MSKNKIALLTLGIFLALFAAGCKKKAPAPPPPPPPPPKAEVKAEAPRISQFSADPTSIERGQSTTLRWAVEGATEVTIDQGIGTVPATGSRQAFPSDTVTYTLTAKGPGGTTTRSVTVNVRTPPPPPPPPPTKPKVTFEDRLMREVQDAYFDYDKSNIREDARSVLTRNADALRAIFQEFPNERVAVEGHCDERGSGEYNLALGDRRATAARDFLVQLGVPADKLTTISYGKERPQCTESDESCWQRNRRAHFAPAR